MDLNVLIVGGGIHGVGVLHDLATRGVGGVHLVEQRVLASGTSSRTTKLVHGGLRYLEHPAQWRLVREALKERTLLLRNLPGIVRPMPFVLPVLPGGRSPRLVRLGLSLYDLFAGRGSPLPRARPLQRRQVLELAPYLRQGLIEREMTSAFLYYDAQMLDDVIVRLAARAAARLGATYAERTRVEDVKPAGTGFRVRLTAPQGGQEVTSRIVVNAAGAWCNATLLRWGFTPKVTCLLDVGSHLVFSPQVVPVSPEACAAALLQHDDGRVVFFLPWEGQWLLGTTESRLDGTPDAWACPAGDRTYLLRVADRYLGLLGAERHLREVFCGIRTIPLAAGASAAADGPVPETWRQDPFSSPFYQRTPDRRVSGFSREAIVDEAVPALVSIYGGKFTTYRALSEQVGDRIARRLGRGGTSGTRTRENWFLDDLHPSDSDLLRSRPELRLS